jgi:hypothetical protein
MPDAKDNAKLTGDTHLPDVESDLPFEEAMEDKVGTGGGTPANRGKATERGDDARPGRQRKHAGLLKDEDAEISDSDGNTRDSGETPRGSSER